MMQEEDSDDESHVPLSTTVTSAGKDQPSQKTAPLLKTRVVELAKGMRYPTFMLIFWYTPIIVLFVSCIYAKHVFHLI